MVMLFLIPSTISLLRRNELEIEWAFLILFPDTFLEYNFVGNIIYFNENSYSQKYGNNSTSHDINYFQLPRNEHIIHSNLIILIKNIFYFLP